MHQAPAPSNEQRNQNFLESVLIPDEILLPLPDTQPVREFIDQILSSCLNNPYYRLSQSASGLGIHLEHVDAFNIKPNETSPGEQKLKSREDMITVHDIYERISRAIIEFCSTNGVQIANPPEFKEYEMQELSQQQNLPDHILETRNFLRDSISWEKLRALQTKTLSRDDDLEVHLNNIQRHNNRFFNTTSTGSNTPKTFHDWLLNIEPLLLTAIDNEYGSRNGRTIH